jgi:F420-dependent oxidoreductase-like protein
MATGAIGLHITGRTAAEIVDGIVRAEARGVAAAWLTTGGTSPDGLTVLAAAAVRTSRVLLGTAITPTYPRHPLVTVQQTLALAQLAPGRFRLGVGPSHKPTMEGMFGIPFERPLRHLRAYLDVLRAALHDGQVDRDEEPYRVHARLTAPVEVPIYASALQEKSFALCGEVADGAITWMCPLPYVRDLALPAMRRGAERADRPLPKLIVHVPVAVSEDAAAVREGARAQLGFYMRVPSYRNMSATAGFPEAGEVGLTDAHVDSLVLHGDELTVAGKLREWFAIGADEIIVAPVAAGEDRAASVERTVALVAALGSVAAGAR